MMKKILLILFLFCSFFAKAQNPVKLTNGDPAWIPNYLILDGNLYFRDGTEYTSLGDSLFYFVSKSDSSYLYYTQRQVDSIFNLYVNRDELVDTLKRYADTNYVKKVGGKWNDGTGGIYYNGNVGINTTTPSQDLDIVGNISVSDTIYLGNWRYYSVADTLKTELYDGTWKLIIKNYK